MRSQVKSKAQHILNMLHGKIFKELPNKKRDLNFYMLPKIIFNHKIFQLRIHKKIILIIYIINVNKCLMIQECQKLLLINNTVIISIYWIIFLMKNQRNNSSNKLLSKKIITELLPSLSLCLSLQLQLFYFHTL